MVVKATAIKTHEEGRKCVALLKTLTPMAYTILDAIPHGADRSRALAIKPDFLRLAGEFKYLPFLFVFVSKKSMSYQKEEMEEISADFLVSSPPLGPLPPPFAPLRLHCARSCCLHLAQWLDSSVTVLGGGATLCLCSRVSFSFLHAERRLWASRRSWTQMRMLASRSSPQVDSSSPSSSPRSLSPEFPHSELLMLSCRVRWFH